ncbi:MAG TPA: holo-ACP synthase [Candidatus Hydrogenedentes bacterium]|nr:holo-ACP synthase [Candidatus Hydrogenedentota bacterium]HRT19541.1 holo-ACP synthase [Candidatus Hydrogenedentota bacterium]HRT64203.1 holo-ACP synthase [Candidatus Hydrogenedentota bacterium]
MIFGIGVDIVDVADFASRLACGQLVRVFSEQEQAYADSRPARRAEILAARWAAREAFAKAVGTGLRAEWPLDQIEVVHDGEGRPGIRLGPALKDLLPPGVRIACALSHTPSYAVAFVCIEQD